MSKNIKTNPLHLGLNAKIIAEPEFTGVEWYEDYISRHKADGAEGRLVAIHTFKESWNNWEMHPKGHEAVICLQGKITLVQEINGKEQKTTLNPYEYAINPPGVWHTADVTEESTALFITAGEGTEHRARG